MGKEGRGEKETKTKAAESLLPYPFPLLPPLSSSLCVTRLPILTLTERSCLSLYTPCPLDGKLPNLPTVRTPPTGKKSSSLVLNFSLHQFKNIMPFDKKIFAGNSRISWTHISSPSSSPNSLQRLPQEMKEWGEKRKKHRGTVQTEGCGIEIQGGFQKNIPFQGQYPDKVFVQISGLFCGMMNYARVAISK